jgi:hypothetical protein
MRNWFRVDGASDVMPGPRRWCCLVKNRAFDLVGVPLVLSSLSDRQLRGLELPDRLGPGLAIEE